MLRAARTCGCTCGCPRAVTPTLLQRAMCQATAHQNGEAPANCCGWGSEGPTLPTLNAACLLCRKLLCPGAHVVRPLLTGREGGGW
jgi:hypothetical protein